MPLGKQRNKVTFGLAKARGHLHRYTYWRLAIALIFTLVIAALPGLGILRFDLWGGHHVYLQRELGLIEVTKRFVFPFLAINLLIIVATRMWGRYLCGFVCPYGSVARLAEWLSVRAKTRRARITGLLTLIAVCALLSSLVFSFWIDWRVFRDGSPLAIALAGSFLASMIASFVWFLRRMGLGFCKSWCPSGVYFALLGHETQNGVAFAHPEQCTDCGACERVCPMDLMPRALAGDELRASSGLYGESMSNHALCIRCGDCVSACEATTARFKAPTPLTMGTLPREPGRASDRGNASETS